MPKPDYTALEFPPPPAGRPYVAVNMVASVDGKVTIEGTEQGIGSEVDQRLMRELRMHADIVLDGAATLRASGASPKLGDPALEQLRLDRGRPRLPIIATITRSGDLPLDRIFFTDHEFRAVVYAAAGMDLDRRAAIEATGRPVYNLPEEHAAEAMLNHMRTELGCELLLAEGGPGINRMLFDADVIDELFLSVGPVIVGGRDGLGPVAGEEPYLRHEVRQMELVHAVPNAETNEVYLRYRRKR